LAMDKPVWTKKLMRSSLTEHYDYSSDVSDMAELTPHFFIKVNFINEKSAGDVKKNGYLD